MANCMANYMCGGDYMCMSGIGVLGRSFNVAMSGLGAMLVYTYWEETRRKSYAWELSRRRGGNEASKCFFRSARLEACVAGASSMPPARQPPWIEDSN